MKESCWSIDMDCFDQDQPDHSDLLDRNDPGDSPGMNMMPLPLTGLVAQRTR